MLRVFRLAGWQAFLFFFLLVGLFAGILVISFPLLVIISSASLVAYALSSLIRPLLGAPKKKTLRREDIYSSVDSSFRSARNSASTYSGDHNDGDALIKNKVIGDYKIKQDPNDPSVIEVL